MLTHLSLCLLIITCTFVSCDGRRKVNLRQAITENLLVSPSPVIFLEESQSPDPIVADPVSSPQFKLLGDSFPVSTREDVYLPWDTPAPKFVPAVRAMNPQDFGVKDVEFDKRSQELADPTSIRRECPRQRCPAAVKCAEPTMHCCKTGNYSYCCPQGTVCLTTKVPMCLKEPDNDPHACTEEVCRPDFHCPLSQVYSCCRGGSTCCPVNTKCTVGDPPTCRVLSRWEFLSRPQPEPVQTVNSITNVLGMTSQQTAAGTQFTREPFPVIPTSQLRIRNNNTNRNNQNNNNNANGATNNSNTPQGSARTSNTNNASTTNTITPPPPPAIPSLFPNPPSHTGQRTRQTSVIQNGLRVTTTETQTTVLTKRGTLKTKTQLHRTVTEVPQGNTQLWPTDEPVHQTFAKALERLQQSASTAATTSSATSSSATINSATAATQTATPAVANK